MAENNHWQWQEPGTAWRGVGVYHVTLTVPSREPLLGRLVILQFCLMPDHLHAVIHVTQVMATSIRSVVRGYWQGVKKLGRAHTLAVAAELNSATKDEGGYPFPVFTERPFIRPLSRRGQLRTMIHYVQMNPQRLATKRLWPGYFRVQKDMEIGGRRFDGVGNAALLLEEAFAPVHVRSWMVEMAAHGDDKALRDYKNGCVLKARKAVVMVSPFISPDEKQVMQVLVREHRSFILITDNGFRDYYKPDDALFDACAAGRLLILSPWPYDSGKRHISRADCVALNAMAEEMCNYLNGATSPRR